jgi:hypothetical protein
VRSARSLVAGAVVLAVLAALLGFAVAGNGGEQPKPRIALFGDSLTFEAHRYWEAMMADAGYDVKQVAVPGISICNLFNQMRKVRDSFHPDVVAFQFVGNAILKCMRNPDGSMLSNADYLRRWRTDTEYAIGLFPKGTPVYLIGPPAMRTPDDRVFTIYRDLARAVPGAHFVDGGRLVAPGRTYVDHLPCLAHEPCTGPVEGGRRTNVVRAWDGVHFCPRKVPLGTPCPVFASGALRFAITEFEGITGRPAPPLGEPWFDPTTGTVPPRRG